MSSQAPAPGIGGEPEAPEGPGGSGPSGPGGSGPGGGVLNGSGGSGPGEAKIKKKRAPAPLVLSCSVCGAPAPEHLHFGGHCCYSCRAFFRRTALRHKDPELLRCRAGTKDCLIDEQHKDCMSCRFNKCLSVGMTVKLMQGKRKLNILDSEDSNSSIHEPEAEEAKGDFDMELYEPESKHEPHLTVEEVPPFESKPVKEPQDLYETPSFSSAAKSLCSAPCIPAFPTQFFPPNPPRLDPALKPNPPNREPNFKLNPPMLEPSYIKPSLLDPSYKLNPPRLEPNNKLNQNLMDPSYKLHIVAKPSTNINFSEAMDSYNQTIPMDQPSMRFQHAQQRSDQNSQQRNCSVFNKPYTIVRPMCPEAQSTGAPRQEQRGSVISFASSQAADAKRKKSSGAEYMSESRISVLRNPNPSPILSNLTKDGGANTPNVTSVIRTFGNTSGGRNCVERPSVSVSADMELTGSAEKQMNFLKWSTDELFALQQQAELNTHLNMLKRGVDGQSFQNFDPTSRYRFHRPDTILPRSNLGMFCFPPNPPNIYPDHPYTHLYRAQQIYRAQAQYFAENRSFDTTAGQGHPLGNLPNLPFPEKHNRLASKRGKLEQFKTVQSRCMKSPPNNVRMEPVDQIFAANGDINFRPGYFNEISDHTQFPDYPNVNHELNAVKVPTLAGASTNYVSSSYHVPIDDSVSFQSGLDVDSFPSVTGIQNPSMIPQVQKDSPQRVREYLQSPISEEEEEKGDWKVEQKIKTYSFTPELDTTQTLNNIAETIFASGQSVPQVDHELLNSDLFRTAEDLISKSFFSHFVDTIATRLPFIPDEVKIEPPSEEDVKVREEPPKESPVEPEPSSSSSSSSIFHLQPNLKFTVEELKLLDEMKEVHNNAMNCVVRLGTNKLMVDTMLGVLTRMNLFKTLSAGKGLQTYNFMKVCKGLPHFRDLSIGAQRALVAENMGICWELRNAAFFWGHNALNLIEQEEQTGISINMKTYILQMRPDAMSLPPMNYDFYYSVPWMKVTQAQQDHKELTREIGKTLVGMDVRLFPLLFAISFFNLEEDSPAYKTFSAADIQIIKTVQQRLLIIYKRFIKHQAGWKRASHILLTQICLLVKLKKCVSIFVQEKEKSAALFAQMMKHSADSDPKQNVESESAQASDTHKEASSVRSIEASNESACGSSTATEAGLSEVTMEAVGSKDSA